MLNPNMAQCKICVKTAAQPIKRASPRGHPRLSGRKKTAADFCISYRKYAAALNNLFEFYYFTVSTNRVWFIRG